jgi:hypothetical protein
VLITVRVHPRASRSRTEWKGDVLEVWVNAPPVDGAANQAVLEAVAKDMGVRPSAVSLRSGARNRTKVFDVRTEKDGGR